MNVTPEVSGTASIADTTLRIWWSARWVGPLATPVCAAFVAITLWDRLPASRLIGWMIAVGIVCVIALASFLSPKLLAYRSRNGLPVVTQIGHALTGLVFGSLLWLHPLTIDDQVIRLTLVASLFAMTAGVSSVLSGAEQLARLVIVPKWTLAALAFIVNGDYVASAAMSIFIAVLATDLRRSTSIWRELVLLRQRDAREVERSEWRAHHDELTGLLNRTGVTARIGDGPVTAMFIDLDHFKHVNDRFGHATGDKVLHAVGQRLITTVRQTDAIARIGGDEFFIVLDGELSDEHLNRVGRSIIAELEEPFELDDGNEVWISASIGYTRLEAGDALPARMMIEADHAMLHAKRRGRRQVAAFTPALEEELNVRSGLESALRKAVRAKAITAAAQPIFDLRSGDVLGVELLARWMLDSGNEVPPSAFVPVAEEAGLIDEITEQMLEHAGQLLAAWATNHALRNARISVNVSPVQISKGKLLETVASVVERHHIRPRQLILELTESATLGEMGSTIELFDSLRTLGVSLTIDDFGTGYSSLGHLLSLPVQAVKIDRSLIGGLGTDPRHTAVMHAVRNLAEVLGHRVIAEGIENPDQVDALVEMGITDGQGFGLLRPVPAEELAEHLSALDWTSLVGEPTPQLPLEG